MSNETIEGKIYETLSMGRHRCLECYSITIDRYNHKCEYDLFKVCEAHNQLFFTCGEQHRVTDARSLSELPLKSPSLAVKADIDALALDTVKRLEFILESHWDYHPFGTSIVRIQLTNSFVEAFKEVQICYLVDGEDGIK